MIRVRGPLGTLRVLLKPGELPWSGEEAAAAATGPRASAASPVPPFEVVSGAPHVG
jgi:hypothetical protein